MQICIEQFKHKSEPVYSTTFMLKENAVWETKRLSFANQWSRPILSVARYPAIRQKKPQFTQTRKGVVWEHTLPGARNLWYWPFWKMTLYALEKQMGRWQLDAKNAKLLRCLLAEETCWIKCNYNEKRTRLTLEIIMVSASKVAKWELKKNGMNAYCLIRCKKRSNQQ